MQDSPQHRISPQNGAPHKQWDFLPRSQAHSPRDCIRCLWNPLQDSSPHFLFTSCLSICSDINSIDIHTVRDFLRTMWLTILELYWITSDGNKPRLSWILNFEQESEWRGSWHNGSSNRPLVRSFQGNLKPKVERCHCTCECISSAKLKSIAE